MSCADFIRFVVKQDGSSSITKKDEVAAAATPIMEASVATAEKATAKPIEPPSVEKPVEAVIPVVPVASNPIPSSPPKPEPVAAEVKKIEDNVPVPVPVQAVAESKPEALPVAGMSPETGKVKASPGKIKGNSLAKTKTSVGEQKPISSLPPVKKMRTKLEMDINIAPSKHAAKDNTASSIEKPSSKVSEEVEEEVSAKYA